MFRTSVARAWIALFGLLACTSILLAYALGGAARVPVRTSPETRAIAYLGQEVPRWHAENHCYSCHNNGDGARALLEAERQGFATAPDSLADTREWLRHPEGWDHNGGEGGFSDKVLARIQFARALADAKPVAQAAALEAGRRLAADQRPDGSWSIDAGGEGSPCTYGNALATAQACQALKVLAPTQEAEAIGRAEAWLTSQPRSCLADNVAVLFGLGSRHEQVRREAAAAILSSQNADGGWGPYARNGSEPFDTAVAILALARSASWDRRTAIERGRRFLIANQLEDGGWIETTRPPGNVSYAQRISTAGWATLALLATRHIIAQ